MWSHVATFSNRFEVGHLQVLDLLKLPLHFKTLLVSYLWPNTVLLRKRRPTSSCSRDLNGNAFYW